MTKSDLNKMKEGSESTEVPMMVMYIPRKKKTVTKASEVQGLSQDEKIKSWDRF